MSSRDEVCERQRNEFIRLLQGDELEEWRIVGSALYEGRKILPEYKGHFGAYAINVFIVDLLLADFPMHGVELGSRETGCVMNTDLDGRPLYIKLKIEEEIAVILSFKISKHE
jgi:hypothetical protein